MKHKRTVLLVCSLSFATASIGYSHWVNSYTYSYKENNKKQYRPVAYIIGREDIKYTSIEKALDVAQSGDIVTLVPPLKDNYHANNNAVIPDNITYEISRNCVIKPGVTLILPTDKKTIATVNSSNLQNYINDMKNEGTSRSRGEITEKPGDNIPSYGNFADSYSDQRYLRVTVRVKSGIQIINQGTLIISGYLSSGANADSVLNGQTSHSYSQIILEKNASIVQNHANSNLHCYGYIKEDVENNNSYVSVENGQVFLPLILRDYKGFFTTSGIEDAINKEKCSPFNQFEFRNIQSRISYKYQGTMIGIINIFMYQDAGKLGTVHQVFHDELHIVGSKVGSLIQFTDSNHSSLEFKYHKKEIADLDIYGGCKINSLKISITIRGITKTLDTANGFLPICYRYNVNLYKTTNQTQAIYDATKQRIKLLPGSKMKLNEGVLLNGNELIAYSAFFDGNKGNIPGHTFTSGAGNYPVKDGATLICDNNATIKMNNIAGAVYCDAPNNIVYQTNTITSKEPWTFKQSGFQYVTGEYAEIKEKLTVFSISNLNKKKIFIGNVRYADPNAGEPNFPCKFNIVNGVNVNLIDNYQCVLFFEGTSDLSIQMLNNINKIKKSVCNNGNFSNPSDYLYNEKINHGDNIILYATSSDISISNNVNGVNEFETQSIKIRSNVPQVNGKDPLYIDKTLQLITDVVDINKVYDKEIIWSTSDKTIASVNQTGEVKGIKLGPVTIYAQCGQKKASYTTEVIKADNLIGVNKVWIEDQDGNSTEKPLAKPSNVTGIDSEPNIHGEYKYKKGETKFYLNINPTDAQITSIIWKYNGSTSSKSYMIDYNGNAVGANTSLLDNGTRSTTIKRNGATNAKPDGMVLRAVVKDINNNEFNIKFVICHSSGFDACFTAGVLINMHDGTFKRAEELKPGDIVKTFNHMTGKIDCSTIIFNNHLQLPQATKDVIILHFEDSSELEIVGSHGFFDCTISKYIIIDCLNYKQFINHNFFKIDGSICLKVKLVKVNIEKRNVKICCPMTTNHMNLFAQNILTLSPETEFFICMFDILDNMQYDKKLIDADIKKYGLYKFEELSDLVNQHVFEGFNLAYVKISVGKGLLTYDEFINEVKKYIDSVNKFNNYK